MPPIKYKPLPPLPDREFVEPIPEPSFIWWLFRNLCVVCKQPGTEINEIIPRSRSKKSVLNWTNRVVICKECHNEYHRHGVNDKKIAEMQQKRVDFLRSMGREEYVNLYQTTSHLPLDLANQILINA